jgi:hypothetical protein
MYLGTKYSTYTVVLYEYDGDFLSVVPNSHSQYPLIFGKPYKLRGKKNTVVLFDSDILHAGVINAYGTRRSVLQFKVVHIDDLSHCTELNKINVNKTRIDTINPYFEMFLRQCSLHFACIINNKSVAYLSQKKMDDSIIQQLIPIKFYNNEKFT